MHTRRILRRLRWCAAAALLAGLLGWCGWLYAATWRPRVQDFPVQGVDVSAEDGAIEWWTVRAGGARFVYARATAGAATRDSRFAEHWQGAYAAGLRRGALHAYSLCQLARDQADNFVSTVPRTDDQLPPAIDLDFRADCPARPARAVVLGEVTRLIAAAETHLGKPAILRVSRAFETQYRISEGIDRRYWSRQPFFPPAYLARRWTMWQASPFHRIEGAERPLHWNVMAL